MNGNSPVHTVLVSHRDGSVQSTHLGVWTCSKFVFKILLITSILLIVASVFLVNDLGDAYRRLKAATVIAENPNVIEETPKVIEENPNTNGNNRFIFLPPPPLSKSSTNIRNGSFYDDDDDDDDDDDHSTCQPLSNIVFIKTAKTGGSTMSSVIYRYGLKNDLVAAFSPIQLEHHSLIREDETSEHYIIQTYNCSDFPGYNILASHIYYNRPAMEELVPNAKYVTLLRSPYTHLKSDFYFTGKYLRFPNAIDPLEEFVTYRYKLFTEDSGQRETTAIQHYIRRFRLPMSGDSKEKLLAIEQLDRELDLVMLTEYYDESLLLLKKLMCWDFEDILYHKMKVHKEYQPPLTQKSIDMITKLAADDIRCYNYFNETFWKRIENYEGDFEADLKAFRSLLDDVNNTCKYGNETSYCELLFDDTDSLRHKSQKKYEKWIC